MAQAVDPALFPHIGVPATFLKVHDPNTTIFIDSLLFPIFLAFPNYHTQSKNRGGKAAFRPSFVQPKDLESLGDLNTGGATFSYVASTLLSVLPCNTELQSNPTAPWAGHCCSSITGSLTQDRHCCEPRLAILRGLHSRQMSQLW